ncbi:MAG: cyanophycin synthetase family protein [Blastocatellia bacterium]
MRIEYIRTLNGDNIYHDAPVLVMQLALEDLAGKETHEVTSFMSRLLTMLPGIKQHYCGRGRTGELTEPTPTTIGFGQVTARVALELATLAGVPVHDACVVHPDGPARCRIAIEFKDESVMRFLLRTAVELVDGLSHGETPPLNARIAEARQLIERPGPRSRASAGAGQWL